MPRRTKTEHLEGRIASLNEALSGALDQLGKLRETGPSPWLFPRGIDFISLAVDLKNEKVELKLSGAPQTFEAEPPAQYTPTVRAALDFARVMERIAPPRPRVDASTPAQAPPVANIPSSPVSSPTLKDISGYWGDCCIGNDTFANNCAHFLSDAFIRTGFEELLPSNSCIEPGARCGPASRPLRARNMWCWFKSKATKTSTSPTRNTGWWAVFQLDESVYWGGHVALLDSDSWTYYGTGWYSDWNQYLYQW